MRTVFNCLLVSAALISTSLMSISAFAAVQPFPAGFKTQTIAANGAQIYVRVGGQGPAVVLLHGYGETGDMWEPLAVKLAGNHTVIVPDLRGMGLSDHPATGYDKKNEARDVAGVLDVLKVGKVDVVAHDIGNMVGLRLCGRISRSGNQARADGRAVAGRRPLG